MRVLTLHFRGWIMRWHQYHAVARQMRYASFDHFRVHASGLFRLARRGMWQMDFFRQTYDFYALPGGANGGIDPRVVDVIFGSRPYASTPKGAAVRQANPASNQFRLEAEHGATLRYHRLESGRILLLLYPANTDWSRPLEDAILLREVSEPSILKDRRVLRGHLRWLIAYMASTSLDGVLLPWQRARLVWLWLCCRRQQDGRWHRPRAVTTAMAMGAWFVSVGLSGAAWSVIQTWHHKEPTHPVANPVVDAVNAHGAAQHQDAVALTNQLAALSQAVQSIERDLQRTPVESVQTTANTPAAPRWSGSNRSRLSNP
jgi:hypothetical protein